MRTRTRRRALTLLVVAFSGALALAAGCTGAVEDVALAALVGREEDFDGRRIRVEGYVRAFEDDVNGRYYVVEDRWSNRVQLMPTSEAAAFEGTDIRVSGRFSFSETEGRRLRIEEIGPLEEGSPLGGP